MQHSHKQLAASKNWLDLLNWWSNGLACRGWGFESPIQPFNFQMLTEFVLISFNKQDAQKTLNIICLMSNSESEN